MISDIATHNGVPASGPVKATPETGSPTAKRLQITPGSQTAGAVHYALVVNTATGTHPTADQLAAVRAELTAWLSQRFPTRG